MMMTDGFLQLFGFKPERAHAARHHQPDIAVADFVGPAGFDDRAHELRVRHRDFEQNRLGRVKQPVNVLAQFEHAAVVGANALENAIAIKQAVVEHRNLRGAFVVIFAVNKDFHEPAQTTAKRRAGKVNLRDSGETTIIVARSVTLWSSG